MTFFNSPLQRAPSRWRRYLAIALFAVIVAGPPMGMLYWSGFFSPEAPVSVFERLVPMQMPGREHLRRIPKAEAPHVNRADDYWNNSPLLKTNQDGLYNVTWRE